VQPLLPQNDPDAEARRHQLEKARASYAYSYDVLSPMPLFKDLPWAEHFSATYLGKRLASAADLPANWAAVKAMSLGHPFDELADYAGLFRVFDKPAIVGTWQDDRTFAEQRVAGVESRTLQRMTARPDNFALSPAQFQAVMGDGASLDAAIAEGRAYMTDYAILDGLPPGELDGTPKILPAPIALYCWRDGGADGRGELVPVAIQTAQRPDGTNLYTPKDAPGDWLLAKTLAQVADINVCWMSSHVCRSHFVMEAFVIATARQLSPSHPLAVLLHPHLQFLLGQDELARHIFINPGGYVDRLLGATLDGSKEIARRAYATWSLDPFALPRELADRGVEDTAALPHYPYRDDGMLLWEEIVRYVGAYLALYYPSPADLAADEELQAWLRELVAEDGGRVKGMTGATSDRAVLTQIVSTVIYISGPQHSSLNYPQWEYATYIPNLPMSAYGSMPARGAFDERALLALLPNQKQSLKQIQIMDLLTSYKYDRLGYYDRPFDDPRAAEVLAAFQVALTAVEVRIERRNAVRRIPYRGLLPSRITNSISA
jgi:arachidonate 15-lipoxygenase